MNQSSGGAGSRNLEYLFTLATVGLVGLAGLALFKLCGMKFGETGFAEYSIARRISGFGAPLLVLGLGVGLAREVARSTTRGTRSSPAWLFVKCLAAVGALGCMVAVGAFVFRTFLATVLFQTPEAGFITFAIAIQTVGFAMYGVTYAYLQGFGRIGTCNLLELSVQVLIPIALLLWISQDVGQWLFAHGAILIVLTCTIAIGQALGSNRSLEAVGLVTLVRTSITRVPGDVSFQLLFVVPPIVTAQTVGFIAGGQVAFLLSLLGAAALPLIPIRITLLAKYVRLFSEGQTAQISTGIHRIALTCVVISALLFLAVVVSADAVNNFFLGGTDSQRRIALIWTAAAIPFFLLYNGLRSIVDAGSARPYNSVNCSIALTLFLILSMVFIAHQSVQRTMAFVSLAICLLAGLTYRRALLLARHPEK